MQEEVENRTLTLVVSGTKFTGRMFKAAILHLRREERRFFAAPSSAFSFCLYPCLLPVRTG